MELIADMGVSERMVCDEVVGLLRPMFDSAALSGSLERDIRARLELFYRSAAAVAALEGLEIPARENP